jgi:hypothetical protein
MGFPSLFICIAFVDKLKGYFNLRFSLKLFIHGEARKPEFPLVSVHLMVILARKPYKNMAVKHF